jgi:outer membrane protein insertion porin family
MLLRTMVSAALALAASGAALAQTQGVSEFTVSDIRLEGLQRISEGTVYNYLPVNIGDRLDQRRLQEAMRAVFATGFFRDVELRREGTTLIVAVLERPSIESFELKGNKDIKTEDLQKSLRGVGLSTGKTFDQSTLDEVKQYLTDQYFARGKYAVNVDAKVEEVPGNKVKVTIDIKEGKRAKIRNINVVGNKVYDNEELFEEFKLKTPNWLSWYRQDDRYSREALSGDLETLRSYYMDRGYANFQIDSTQVTIAPEKDDMFITVNITEGDVYTVSDVKLAGNLVVPEEELKKYILIKAGDTYSRKYITATTELIKQRLGLDGYAFAKVDPVPQTDEQNKTISLSLLVDPGNRVYVRRVNFTGATSVNDEVFRREMRQLEGAYLSNAAVDRSKERIQRLPFIEKVEPETKPVAGATDLVDVEFKIEEGLPGQFSAGIGYSESYSFMLNGSFAHSNFMGSGERVAAEVNAGKYQKSYAFSHTNPYTTVDRLERTFSLGYRESSQPTSATSEIDTKMISAGLSYGYPITEYQTISAGISAQRAELITVPEGSALQTIAWVRRNGIPYIDLFTDGTPPQTFEIYGTKYDTFLASLGWSFDSRNRTLFADRGARVSAGLGYAIPGSDIEYWTASASYLQFVPLVWGLTFMFNGDVNYGEALNDTTALAPYQRWFAGGPDSVRGFRESRLGPKDSYGRPYGGNLKMVAQSEILFPMPEKWRNSARFSLFYDIGNVFSHDGTLYNGFDGYGYPTLTPVEYRFSYDELKQSAGVAVQWLAPLGVFRFSYGIPLNAKPADGFYLKDETERFQFSIGQAF